MCVKLLFEELNPNSYFSHIINTNTYKVIITIMSLLFVEDKERIKLK